MSFQAPQVADQSLFTKSRVEENTIARKAELAATYSNINSSVPSASVVVYPNGYLLSPKANRSSFPVLCKTLTEPNTAESKRESRLSFLTTSISPMTNNNFRTSADTGLNEPNSKESSLKSSSSQERISQRLSQTDATSPRQKLSSSGRGSEFLAQGYTPRSAHGRECPSIPLPAPPAAPSRAPIVVSSPRSKPGGKKMSQIIASGQISPYSYSPHSPFSPNSSGTAAGTVICAAGDGARKVDEDGVDSSWPLPPSGSAPRSLTSSTSGAMPLGRPLSQGSRNTGGGECAPHVRPVSQSEENFPCVNESRKESTEFEFSTLMHGASESFRPNGFSISFSKAGEDPADLLNSRKDTPPLREASDIPRTQTPEMPIKAPNALTAPPCEPRIPPASGPALALPPPCDPQIPPASGPATVPVPSSLSPFSKDRMIGARRFSTSVYPPANPLRRMSSIPGFSPVQHSLNESPQFIAASQPSGNSLVRRASMMSNSRLCASPTLPKTAAPSRRISVYHPPENLKSWSYRVDKNEWIQIPVLFDLFTYLIQFHELQERTCEDRSEATIMEEALSCLVSRISHSIYEVDGVLLSSLFTTWENPNHKQLVKNLCDSWKVGYNSHEFQEASMTLLRAISDNDVSDVRFTRLYKLWRWIGSVHNRRIVGGSLVGMGASLAALIIIGYLLANKIALAIHIVLLLLALLLTTCITLLSIITLSHNSFADAASTFFREDARSATQLETYFTGGEDEDRVEYIDSGLPQDTGVEGNSHHTYPEGHGRGNFSHNRNASHHSFLTVFSNSGEAGDSEQGDSHGVMGTESETLNHLFLNSATAIPDRNGGFGVVGLPNASVDNPLIAEAQDLSFSGGPATDKPKLGNSSLHNYSLTHSRSKPVVMLTEEEEEARKRRENSDAAGSDVVEERRLKRSESKRYLLSRSTTGNTSGIGQRVAALVVKPAHLIPEGERKAGAEEPSPIDLGNNSPPLEQRHYDAFISALQRRGFVVREYDSVGLLDEGFHQGANKFCLLALPLEMWTSSRKWRTVFSRWLEIERRAVYFYRMSKSSSNSSTGDHHGVSALPSGDGVGIGAVPSTASFSRGRKDALPTLTLVDEPQPPANTCLSLPLSDVLSSRIYQRVSDRNLKKVILHSYVPPYILGSRLGNGAFASVFEAVLEETGTRCAVKRVEFGGDRGGDSDDDSRDSDDPDPRLVAGVEEAELLSRVVHPNIVRYMYTEIAGHILSIFMERCGGGTLTHLLTKSRATLTAPRIKQILTEIISAVAFLQVKLIIHRDLKPDNILFHDDGSVRLIDFGSAGLRKENFAAMEGTFGYMAPEVLLGNTYGKECDVWSVGCIAADVLSVELPQRNMNYVELSEFFRDMKESPSFSCTITPVKTFLLGCLKRDPSERLGWIELLEQEILRPESNAIAQWLAEVNRIQAQNRAKHPSKGVTRLGSSDSNMSLFSTQL